MKHLLSVIIIIAMVLAQLAVVSCGEKDEDTLLTGVFTKTGVDLGEGFIANDSPVLSGGELRVVGTLRDGDDYSPAMAVVDTSDLSAAVDKLPISGTASGFAVGDDGILYIVSRFDSETFNNVYTFECVKDGGAYSRSTRTDCSISVIITGAAYMPRRETVVGTPPGTGRSR